MTHSNTRTVTPEIAHLALDALVRQLYQQSWGKARGWIESGKIRVNGEVILDLRSFPGPGAVLVLDMNAPRPGKGAMQARSSAVGAGLKPDQVVYVDSQLIVVDKPSGVSTVPFDKGETGTLQDWVCQYLGQRKIEVVQRLDKETSGLIVFARNREAAQKLGNQFRFHTIHRRYLALAHGAVKSQTIRSVLIENRGDGLRGSSPPTWRVAPDEGKEAVTHVKVLNVAADRSMSSIECTLETGRTHQIRIHLSEAGHPLLGEKLYIRDYRGTLLNAPRVMLHAAELGFKHPTSGAPMSWTKNVPSDFL